MTDMEPEELRNAINKNCQYAATSGEYSHAADCIWDIIEPYVQSEREKARRSLADKIEEELDLRLGTVIMRGGQTVTAHAWEIIESLLPPRE